jgi:hypothetical protein
MIGSTMNQGSRWRANLGLEDAIVSGLFEARLWRSPAAARHTNVRKKSLAATVVQPVATGPADTVALHSRPEPLGASSPLLLNPGQAPRYFRLRKP